MVKKREIFYVGYPVYSCRLCGGSFYGFIRRLDDLADKVRQLTMTEEFNRAIAEMVRQKYEPLIPLELYTLHSCGKHNRGLADFKGMGKIRDAILYRGSWVDPHTKEKIPLELT